MESSCFRIIWCVLLMLAPVHAGGATITASSNSRVSVQAAVNSAVDGDVVVIPNGPVAWFGTVTISGKGIHLRASTLGAVTITHHAGGDALIDVGGDFSQSVEISGINFLAGSSTGVYLRIEGAGAVPLVHDCTFQVPDFILQDAILITRRGGVIWNCTFSSNDPDGSGGGCLHLLVTDGSSSWTTAPTMGNADTTGTENTYIEDCTFNNIFNQCIDADNNIRAVIRRNLFKDSQITIHGADTSSDGARHTEIYDNTFVFTASGAGATYPLSLNRFVFMRGGTGIITGNVIPDINSELYGERAEITAILMNARRNAGPYPCPSLSAYPVPHQIGQSHDGTNRVTDPLYMWGNTGDGLQDVVLLDYDTDECGNGLTTADFVKPGRDYIVGTPKPGWSPFPYPHPFRSDAGSGMGTNPVVALSMTGLEFGAVEVGQMADLKITVRNAGGGTLAGTVTTALPFSIVGTASYNLASTQVQVITVRYAPQAAGTHNGTLTFTGGGGGFATLSGSAP